MDINLVPAQELVSIYDKKLMIKKIIIAASIVGSIVLLAVVVQAFKAGAKARLVKSLEGQYTKYIKLEKSIKSLRQAITDSKKKQRQLSSILPEQFYWSEKLMRISNIKPGDIWFNDLKIDYSSGYQCTINGYLFNTDETKRPIASLNEFVKDLKADPLMIKAFSTIQVKKIRKELLNQKKVLSFTIFLEYKEKMSEE